MIYCHSDHLFVQDCHSRTKTFANIFTCHKNSPMHEIPNYRTGPAKVWSSPGFNGPLGPDRLPFPVLKFPSFLGIQYISWENINRLVCVLVKWIEEDYLSNIRLSCIMRFGSFKIISLPIQDFRTVPNWKFKFGAKVLIWIGAQKFSFSSFLAELPISSTSVSFSEDRFFTSFMSDGKQF